jgi:hypothetical protein
MCQGLTGRRLASGAGAEARGDGPRMHPGGGCRLLPLAPSSVAGAAGAGQANPELPTVNRCRAAPAARAASMGRAGVWGRDSQRRPGVQFRVVAAARKRNPGVGELRCGKRCGKRLRSSGACSPRKSKGRSRGQDTHPAGARPRSTQGAGASTGIRTLDLAITNRSLYQLSYRGPLPSILAPRPPSVNLLC